MARAARSPRRRKRVQPGAGLPIFPLAPKAIVIGLLIAWVRAPGARAGRTRSRRAATTATSARAIAGFCLIARRYLRRARTVCMSPAASALARRSSGAS